MQQNLFNTFNLYDELTTSLNEAISYKEGDKSKAKLVVREIPTPEYNSAEVKRIRKNLHLSQSGFALALGVSKRTVEAWETGKNAPSNSSNKLLYLIEKDNSIINRLISV